MLTFETDPANPGMRLWQRPARPIVQFLFVVAAIGFSVFIVAPSAVRAVFSPLSDPLFAAVLIAVYAIMLCAVVAFAESQWRIYKGSRELAIRLTKQAIELTLPAYRSLAHPSPAFEGAIPINAVRAIETRPELYSQFGAKSVARTYRLVPRTGEPIFLFAETIPADNPNGSQAKGLISEMAAHAQLPLSDLGMVQSKAGILGIWRARPAEWSAATADGSATSA